MTRRWSNDSCRCQAWRSCRFGSRRTGRPAARRSSANRCRWRSMSVQSPGQQRSWSRRKSLRSTAPCGCTPGSAAPVTVTAVFAPKPSTLIVRRARIRRRGAELDRHPDEVGRHRKARCGGDRVGRAAVSADKGCRFQDVCTSSCRCHRSWRLALCPKYPKMRDLRLGEGEVRGGRVSHLHPPPDAQARARPPRRVTLSVQPLHRSRVELRPRRQPLVMVQERRRLNQ